MTAPTAIEAPSPPVVAAALACAGCGYLLRGLDPAGRCPECNHPIAASIEANKLLPARRTLRALKCGAVALTIAIATLDLPSQFAYSRYHPNFGAFYINPDGTKYLLSALLLTPAAWWLSRAEPADKSPWRRRVVLTPPLLLALLALLMFLLIQRFINVHLNATLVASYGVAPILVALEIILLLGVLARQAPLIPRGPRAWWVRAPQCLFGGAMLLAALAWQPITIGRILQMYELYTPPPGQYIPHRVNVVMQPILEGTQRTLGPLLLGTVAGLLGYTVVLFRRTRFTAP